MKNAHLNIAIVTVPAGVAVCQVYVSVHINLKVGFAISICGQVG